MWPVELGREENRGRFQGLVGSSQLGDVRAQSFDLCGVPAGAVTSGRRYYFAAKLLGRNEVPEPGKKVNDPDGEAVARFRVSGNRFYYFVQWKNTGRPTAFHIHRGKAGVNGPVVIDLSHRRWAHRQEFGAHSQQLCAETQ